MQMIKLFMVSLLLGLGATTVYADTVGAEGMATVIYSGPFSETVKMDAIRQAKANALDRYFAEGGQAEAKNYDAVRSQLVSSIDDYILGTTVLSEETNAQEMTYAVVVRIDLNESKLLNTLQAHSAMSNKTETDKSLLTFIFVARQQKSIQSFDDKVYRRQDDQTTNNQLDTSRQNTSETERVRATEIDTGDHADYSANRTETSSTALTSGGSVTKKADVVTWDVTRASEINSVMTGAFSNAGYEVVEADYLEQGSDGLNVDAIRKDYSTGDDLQPLTLRNTVNGVKAAHIPYLALGTLDVGLKDIDPTTGLVRVYVTVSGKVLNVSGRFPRTISAVGPVQFAGLGPTETVARTNALKEAAGSTAKELIDELNAKGVN